MADTGVIPDTATKQRVKHSIDSIDNNISLDENQEQLDIFDAPLCSGQNIKIVNNFTPITLKDINSMVKNPVDVKKLDCPYFIPSNLMSKTHQEQRDKGKFYALVADVDWKEVESEKILTMLYVAEHFNSILPDTQATIYASKSATPEIQKCRIVIPLAVTVSGTDFEIYQEILNDKLDAAGVIPDRATERAGQMYFLPNKGQWYNFIPMEGRIFEYIEWADEYAQKKKQIEIEHNECQRIKEKRAQEQLKEFTNDKINIIKTYNDNTPIEAALNRSGFKQIGNKYLSPNSSSKSPGVKILGTQAISYHGSDSDIGVKTKNVFQCFDAFSLFQYFECGNDRKTALHEAGNMFTTAQGITIEKHNQRIYMKEQDQDMADRITQNAKKKQQAPDEDDDPDFEFYEDETDGGNIDAEIDIEQDIEQQSQSVKDFKEWLNSFDATIEDETVKNAHILANWIQKYIELNINDVYAKEIKDTVSFKTGAGLRELNKLLSKSLKKREREKRQEQVKQTEESNQPKYNAVMSQFNEKHACIMIGGKFRILEEFIEPVMNYPDVKLMSYSDFKSKFLPYIIPHPTKPEKTMVATDFWLTNKERRSFEGIIFEPNAVKPKYYNLWKGFSITPKQGDWSKMQWHIEHIICNGDEERTRYVLAWFAHIVQRPDKKHRTAIVLKSGEGTGKNMFIDAFGYCLGSHYKPITQHSHLIGQFNNHLKDCVLLFANEAMWGGDKQSIGVLKSLITDDYIMIENKGIDKYRVKNHTNLVMASNNEWIIPADEDARRFNVFEVSEAKKGDFEYFKDLAREIETGGREAMLYDLLHMDISGVNLDHIERNGSLFKQQLRSMNSISEYWYHKLQSGYILPEIKDVTGNIEKMAFPENWEDATSNPVLSDDQYIDYLIYCKNRNKRIEIETAFGIFFTQKLGIKTRRPTIKGQGRKKSRVFPDLAECKKRFAEIFKVEESEIFDQDSEDGQEL